jgi:hypothetical protein
VCDVHGGAAGGGCETDPEEDAVTDPRDSDDKLVNAIVKTADALMKTVEGIAYGAIGGGVLDNARALVELDRIHRQLARNKQIKRHAIIEQTARVGQLATRKRKEPQP